MTAPEVDWVLDQFGSVVSAVATNYSLAGGDDVTLTRVNRDEARTYDGDQPIDQSIPIRDRTAELRQACYAGATLADQAPEPIGTEYDHRMETIVAIRVEGLHHSEYGHVDPDGVDGVPWRTPAKDGLVDRLRTALTDAKRYPPAGDVDTTYTDLRIDNHDPGSAAWADYYRTDLEVLFRGYEELS